MSSLRNHSSPIVVQQARLSLDPLEISQQSDDPPVPSEARREVDRLDWTAGDLATLSSVFRHSGWAPIRRRVYASLQRTMQPVNRILAFSSCGDVIRVLENNDDDMRFKLVGNYCHDRWCTPCAVERARTIAHNVLDLAGTNRLRFLTLTLKASVMPLVDRLSYLRTSFARLKRTRLWKRSVSAGIACLEVKRYLTVDGWHCHYHVLFQGRYIVRTELAATWKAITGDSDIVDVRLARDRRNVAKYITKYVSKPLDTTFVGANDLLDEAIRALKGVRLMDTFGAWRGKPLTRTVDDGKWHDVGTLDSYVIAAYEGNTFAKRVIASLHRSGTADALLAAAEWRPPVLPRPPPEPPTTPSLFGDSDRMECFFAHER